MDLVYLLLGLFRAKLDLIPVHCLLFGGWRVYLVWEGLVQYQAKRTLVPTLLANFRRTVLLPLLDRLRP